MSMEITSNYSNYAAQNVGNNNSKKKETEKTEDKTLERTTGRGRSKSTAEYMNELAKLVPSAKCSVGTSFSSSQNGKTLTINPKLLEKMQSDPEKEKEMKELIKGAENAMTMLDNVYNAKGWSVVFKNDYIDENGKYHQVCLVRNDYMLNMSDKLREERKQNAEKLLEKTKEKAAKKAEELQDMLEDKKSENSDKETALNSVEQLLEDKLSASKDGVVYLDDLDMQQIIEAAKENDTEKSSAKEQMKVGANIDLQV